MTETVTLYRPVGPEELTLIEASSWKSFPPRLTETLERRSPREMRG